MSFFSSPTSFRLNALHSTLEQQHFVPMMYSTAPANESMFDLGAIMDAQESIGAGHPSLMNLVLLVFEAVMEVVCVSLPGYIIARCGLFDAENQKFVANLNVSLFTPCLSMSCVGEDGL
jgi:hypothetical protein